MRLWRWLILVLGVWQLSSSYALHISDPLIAQISVLLGLLIVLAGVAANLTPDRWPFVASGIFGLALVGMPFLHHSAATTEFMVVGALTSLASLVEYVNRHHA